MGVLYRPEISVVAIPPVATLHDIFSMTQSRALMMVFPVVSVSEQDGLSHQHPLPVYDTQQ